MQKPRSPMEDYARYATLGFEMLAAVLLCAGAGYGLDRWTGTQKPWFLLAGALLGCSVAMYQLIRRFSAKDLKK